MTGPERDSDVDDWLQARRSLLRNADDALTLEPPPELDQRVIDRARRELRAAQAEKPRFFRSSRFTMPFAIAATVVLSFSLVLEFNRYESGREALRARAENTSAATITLTPSVGASADVAPAPAPGPAPIAEAAVREAKQEQPARRRQDAFSQSNASAMVSREAAEVRGGSLSDASDDKADANLMAAAAPAAPPPAMAAPSTMAAPTMATPVASARLESDATASRAAAKSAPAAAVAQTSGKDTVADAAPRSAAQWWQVVEQLQRAGRKTEAEVELKALRQAYPDFVVPAAQAQPQQ
jgi:hypothetical protein